MSWIKTIPYNEATGVLKRLYEKIAGPDQNVDNVLLIHSLRPNTLKGHMALYKSVLHSAQNTLPKWYLEAIGVYVSMLNECTYCVQHHQQGLKRLLNNEKQYDKLITALIQGTPERYFEGKLLQGLYYAKDITLAHSTIAERHIETLRLQGFLDGEILEINQVAAYFNYVNRMVVGLGVTTEGDILGLSPGDHSDQDNWAHH